MGDLYSEDLLQLAEGDKRPDFDDTAFFDAADMVYNAGGFDNAQMTTPEARRLIGETLKQLVTGISSGLPHEVPETVRYALENNAFIFSGFKAFHSLREVGLSLLDEKGNIKSFEAFHQDVVKVNNRYNHNYLYAEYNHAVGASLMAARWHRFEADGDKYDLQYRTAEDDHVREDHAILNGTTLPPSDPFWGKYLPPNGWNCRCTAVQVRKGKYPLSDSELSMKRGDNCTETAKQQIFRFNPGKELALFPPKHPYYKAPKEVKKIIEELSDEQKKEQIAKRRQEIRAYMASHLNDQLVNPDFDKKTTMSGGTVKEFLNQPHAHYMEKNELLMTIKQVFNNAKYLGINPTYQKKGLKYSHVFEIELAGDKSWLLVREYEDGRCYLYSCSDNPKIATGLQKNKDPE